MASHLFSTRTRGSSPQTTNPNHQLAASWIGVRVLTRVSKHGSVTPGGGAQDFGVATAGTGHWRVVGILNNHDSGCMQEIHDFDHGTYGALRRTLTATYLQFPFNAVWLKVTITTSMFGHKSDPFD